jgi:hypothetical protein
MFNVLDSLLLMLCTPWYLHDVQTHGMLLSAKLGRMLAVYEEAAVIVITSNAVRYTPTANFTFTRKTTGHLYNMYTNTVTILILCYSLIYFKVSPREELFPLLPLTTHSCNIRLTLQDYIDHFIRCTYLTFT